MSSRGAWGHEMSCVLIAARRLRVPPSHTTSQTGPSTPRCVCHCSVGRGVGGGLMDLRDSDLCSQRCRVVAWWSPAVFHTFYLCLAHKNCKLREAFTHIACGASLIFPYPLCHAPVSEKIDFSTTHQSRKATEPL